MKMPDFNVKKLVKEAGTQLSRVVQVIRHYLLTNLLTLLLISNKLVQSKY